MKTLTKEQEAANYHTFRHIERLRNLLNVFIVALLRRGELHDQSKLEGIEWKFLRENPESEDEEKMLAIAHTQHVGTNRHHPEHWRDTLWIYPF